MTAAIRATDLLVLLAAVTGALVLLVGLASFDPRVRERMPLPALAGGSTRVRAGLLVAGAALLLVAVG